jgi:hypothetical protein
MAECRLYYISYQDFNALWKLYRTVLTSVPVSALTPIMHFLRRWIHTLVPHDVDVQRKAVLFVVDIAVSVLARLSCLVPEDAELIADCLTWVSVYIENDARFRNNNLYTPHALSELERQTVPTSQLSLFEHQARSNLPAAGSAEALARLLDTCENVIIVFAPMLLTASSTILIPAFSFSQAKWASIAQVSHARLTDLLIPFLPMGAMPNADVLLQDEQYIIQVCIQLRILLSHVVTLLDAPGDVGSASVVPTPNLKRARDMLDKISSVFPRQISEILNRMTASEVRNLQQLRVTKAGAEEPYRFPAPPTLSDAELDDIATKSDTLESAVESSGMPWLPPVPEVDFMSATTKVPPQLGAMSFGLSDTFAQGMTVKGSHILLQEMCERIYDELDPDAGIDEEYKVTKSQVFQWAFARTLVDSGHAEAITFDTQRKRHTSIDRSASRVPGSAMSDYNFPDDEVKGLAEDTPGENVDDGSSEDQSMDDTSDKAEEDPHDGRPEASAEVDMGGSNLIQ